MFNILELFVPIWIFMWQISSASCDAARPKGRSSGSSSTESKCVDKEDREWQRGRELHSSRGYKVTWYLLIFWSISCEVSEVCEVSLESLCVKNRSLGMVAQGQWLGGHNQHLKSWNLGELENWKTTVKSGTKICSKTEIPAISQQKGPKSWPKSQQKGVPKSKILRNLSSRTANETAHVSRCQGVPALETASRDSIGGVRRMRNWAVSPCWMARKRLDILLRDSNCGILESKDQWKKTHGWHDLWNLWIDIPWYLNVFSKTCWNWTWTPILVVLYQHFYAWPGNCWLIMVNHG